MKKLALIFAMMLFCIMNIGCGPELLIGPAVNFFLVWKNGEAIKYYRYDSGTVYRAAKRSALEMGLPIITDDDEADNNYYFTAGENNRFKIKVIPVESNVCKLNVRINFMGDKDYAEAFYDRVDQELSVIQFGPNGKPTPYKF